MNNNTDVKRNSAYWDYKSPNDSTFKNKEAGKHWKNLNSEYLWEIMVDSRDYLVSDNPNQEIKPVILNHGIGLWGLNDRGSLLGATYIVW